jgi:hypothetical protein
MKAFYRTLLFILGAYLSYTVITNTKTKNNIIDEGISIIKKEYELEELDIGEFKTVYIYKVLPFKSEEYYIKGLGVLSVMTLNLGAMQQLTFNINPFEKDIPQLTIDYTIMLNQRKIYIEVYKLMINSETENYNAFLTKLEEIEGNYKDLKDFKASEDSWRDEYFSDAIYKSGNPLNEGKLLNLFKDVLNAYIEYAKKENDLDSDKKAQKVEVIKEFSDKLVENGGIAINNFKKTLGDEKTKEFLGKVLYGYLHAK